MLKDKQPVKAGRERSEYKWKRDPLYADLVIVCTAVTASVHPITLISPLSMAGLKGGLVLVPVCRLILALQI